MKLYLVLNVEDPNEPFVIDICTNEVAAKKLTEKYIDNFRKFLTLNDNSNPEEKIKVEEIDVTDVDVIWSAYPNEESFVTYNN